MSRRSIEEGLRLGGRTNRLVAIDYYTVPWHQCPAGTPPAVMVAARELATGHEEFFAWHLIAEEQGIPPEEILARQVDLEPVVLTRLLRYVERRPKARWLHWGLNKIEYSFSALARRAIACGLDDWRFPDERLLDASEVLKRQYGEGYAPHPRLHRLVALNGINNHQLLTVPELTDAFNARNFAGMLRSLMRKLACLQRIVELHSEGALRTLRSGGLRQKEPVENARAAWIGCARTTLGGDCSPEHLNDQHDGPVPPCWLRWKGVSHKIGSNKSRRPWQLLNFMWARETALFGSLQGPGKIWRDPVSVSTFSTTASRVNASLPPDYPRHLTVSNVACCISWLPVTGKSQENHGE